MKLFIKIFIIIIFLCGISYARSPFYRPPSERYGFQLVSMDMITGDRIPFNDKYYKYRKSKQDKGERIIISDLEDDVIKGFLRDGFTLKRPFITYETNEIEVFYSLGGSILYAYIPDNVAKNVKEKIFELITINKGIDNDIMKLYLQAIMYFLSFIFFIISIWIFYKKFQFNLILPLVFCLAIVVTSIFGFKLGYYNDSQINNIDMVSVECGIISVNSGFLNNRYLPEYRGYQYADSDNRFKSKTLIDKIASSLKEKPIQYSQSLLLGMVPLLFVGFLLFSVSILFRSGTDEERGLTALSMSGLIFTLVAFFANIAKILTYLNLNP